MQLAKKGIRVNAVAPGPIWTPLIPSSFDEQKISKFGSNNPMERAGQPVECSGAYVFLASDEASFITGQTIHFYKWWRNSKWININNKKSNRSQS